jgi:hypothetical protein
MLRHVKFCTVFESLENASIRCVNMEDELNALCAKDEGDPLRFYALLQTSTMIGLCKVNEPCPFRVLYTASEMPCVAIGSHS